MIPRELRQQLIEQGHASLSIREQCRLLGLHRSNLYYVPREIDAEELSVMAAIDKLYTAHPFYGIRKITQELKVRGVWINHKRVARLMHLMGIQSVAPKPNLSKKCPENKVYPYLLRNLEITRPNQVWSTDITYIPMRYGFMYLTAVIDWYSRYVLAWELSNTLEAEFCVEALSRALEGARPEIFNTDQGAQFTSDKFIGRLLDAKIAISMDGKGRALDNVFIERLWRSLKYEQIYLRAYADGLELRAGIQEYFTFFNYHRLHAALGYQTPAVWYKKAAA